MTHTRHKDNKLNNEMEGCGILRGVSCLPSFVTLNLCVAGVTSVTQRTVCHAGTLCSLKREDGTNLVSMAVTCSSHHNQHEASAPLYLTFHQHSRQDPYLLATLAPNYLLS